MKKILLLIFALVISSQTIKAQVVLDANGVTIKWTGTTIPSVPYFVQASPRGTLEWFAIVIDASRSNIIDYAKNNPAGITYFTRPGSSAPIPLNNIVTTFMTDMESMFDGDFNQPIGSWDVGKVTDMRNMFKSATSFNQPIGSWNVSNVINMQSMFEGATSFNQPIGSWDVSKVVHMSFMFAGATSFDKPIGNWNVSKVIYMSGMFNYARAFNQPLGNWNVSNVTDISYMFAIATSFNQNIDSWNVTNLNSADGMSFMFAGAKAFNQPIGSWNVSNVTSMVSMFDGATSFNQPIGSWNVSNVISMSYMFAGATSFNQPIGSWDVSKVYGMNYMFHSATSFNQPIGSWNVVNLQGMSYMFSRAFEFNQNIGSWNVSNVTEMYKMFINGAGLSIANYDSLLIGWSTITIAETPLKQGVTFDAGSNKYCNGASARASLVSKYGWTITDGGLDCSSLGVEEFETSKLKIYPNPTNNIINIEGLNKNDNNTIQIFDVQGKLVITKTITENGTIDLSELNKGVYVIKIGEVAQRIVKM